MNKLCYPTSLKSFHKICSSNNLLFNKNYNKISNINIYDITLSYGLYHLNLTEQQKYNTTNKLKLYDEIINNHKIKNIELGILNNNLINNNKIEIFENNKEFLNIIEYNYNIFDNEIINYMIFQENDNTNINKHQLIQMLMAGVKNFAFSTSHLYTTDVCNKNNVCCRKNKMYNNIFNSLNFLYNLPPLDLKKNIDIYSSIKPYNIKLYIDIDYYDTKDTNNLINKLFYLNKLNIDKICIIDKTGGINYNDFVTIISNIKNNYIIDKISLQLHCNDKNELQIEKIFHTAIDYGINEFNVIENILTEKTVVHQNIVPVLTYDKYYKFLLNYLKNNN